MKKTRSKLLCAIATLLGALFVAACVAGFAACGGDEHVHTWDDGEVTTEATCEGTGVKTFTCTDCGDTKTDTIPALGHDWVSGTAVGATCTKDGYTPQTCSRCDAEQKIDETAALGHILAGTYTPAVIDNSTDPDNPTVTTAGYWTYTCSQCDKTIDLANDPVASVTLTVTDEESLAAAAAWTDVSGVVPTAVVDTYDETLESSTGIALSGTLIVSSAIVLDLSGETITPGTITDNVTTGWTPVAKDDDNGIRNDVMISVAEGATLTIEDTSSDGSGKINYNYTGSTIVKSADDQDTWAWNTSVNNGAAIEMDGGDLVLKSGTIESVSVGIRAKSGNVEMDGGMVLSSGYYVIWEDTGKVDVTINGGVVAGKTHGIFVDGDSNFGHYSSSVETSKVEEGSVFVDGAETTLTVNGGTVYSGGVSAAAIRTENGSSRESTKITITAGDIICGGALTVDGNEIFSEDDITNTREEKIGAIFLANGTLDISGGNITGPTALEIQGGKVKISDGTFTATGSESQSIKTELSSSDQYTYGYALAIVPTGWFYKYYYEAQKTEGSTFTTAVDVTVTGGTFVGDVYVAAHNAWGYCDDNSTDPVHLGVDGKYDGQDSSIQSAELTYVWTVDLTGQSADAPYVVVIDSSVLTLKGYTSSNTEANEEEAVYYLWSYVSSIEPDNDGV